MEQPLLLALEGEEECDPKLTEQLLTFELHHGDFTSHLHKDLCCNLSYSI